MRLAILIDAENVDAAHFHRVRRDAQGLGNIAVCRVFGDFTEPRLKDWVNISRSNGLEPVMQFSGKNSADMTMAINAMELAVAGNVDGVCIVSSDSDFLPLIQWLRARDLAVYGFGEQKTPHAMRKMCSDFIELNATPKAVAKKAA